MSDINVQLKDGAPVPVPDSATVAEALKKLDRELAKQALAAKVGGREVDLTALLQSLLGDNGAGQIEPINIEPICPQTRDGLEVLRHSTAHLLAAAVLDLFPGTKLTSPNGGRPSGDRKADEADRQPEPRLSTSRDSEIRGVAYFQRARRAIEV
jgi:hypothetical protein